MNPAVVKAMQYGLPAMSLLIMFPQPAATQVVFATTAVWAYFQASLLRSNKVREWLYIQPLPPTAPKTTDTAKSYKGTMTTYQAPGAEAPKESTVGGLKSWWRATVLDQGKAALKKRQEKSIVTQQSNIREQRRKQAAAYEAQRRIQIQAQKELEPKVGGKRKQR